MPTLLNDFCEKNNYPPRTVKGIIKKRAVPVLKIGAKLYFDDEAEDAFWEAVRINKVKAAPSRRKGERELEAALKATRPRRASV
jgi:hypothetical protein